MHGNFKAMAMLSPKAQEMRARGLLNSRNELLLYGVIGSWWEGLDALAIVRELETLDGDEIVIRIHSPGGVVTEGLAMANALRNSTKTVRIYIDGICASIATVIAMAASKGQLHTPDNALWMFHKPWAGVEGNAEKLREFADNLDVIEESMIAAYIATGRFTSERIREIFATGKDVYMTGAEVVVEGIADQLLEPLQQAASVDLSNLSQPPDSYKPLYDFYAVNAANHPPANDEETRMKKLHKLLALQVALATMGIAMDKINTAVALAFGVKDAELPPLLAEGTKATDKQFDDAIAALETMQTTEQAAIQARAQSQVQTPPNQNVVDPQTAIANERRRISEINALALRHGLPDTQRNTLIDNGSTLEQARAAALEFLATGDRNRQPLPGLRVMDTTGAAFQAAMSNAMLNRMQPGLFKLEEAGREFRGMSLLQMAAACLERAGVNTRGMTPNELAAKALNTTSDFPNIVADVANKVLLKAYQAQPRTFLAIANQATISDFKLRHAIEIGGGSDLQEVKESGEYEHGNVTEGKLSYRLSTYGRIFAFSRQLLINDDIGAFTQFMSNIGALAARKESSVVWTLVKAGSIFSSGNKNLVASGGTVDETQLDKVRMLFRKQTGVDGEPINITARHLVVNSDRETVAQKMLSAVQATATSGTNVFANSMNLIVEPLLDGVTNNPWYAFADPTLVPTLEYAYLEGESGPYIETKNGFEVDGIQIKVRHDFGAGWVSHRGAVKNPGA